MKPPEKGAVEAIGRDEAGRAEVEAPAAHQLRRKTARIRNPLTRRAVGQTGKR